MLDGETRKPTADGARVHNDEAATTDALGRDQFAAALARIAENCDTPLVVGLYGTWGLGKTSLMKLIEGELDTSKAQAVWFDPWQHQFDENPALAMLHKMVCTFGLDKDEKIKKTLTVISTAFGSLLLKAATTLDLKDIRQLGEQYEDEKFQVRDKQLLLQGAFSLRSQDSHQKDIRGTHRLFYRRSGPVHACAISKST